MFRTIALTIALLAGLQSFVATNSYAVAFTVPMPSGFPDKGIPKRPIPPPSGGMSMGVGLGAGLGGMGAMGFGPLPMSQIYLGEWISPKNSIEQTRASIGTPIYKNEKDSVALFLSGGNLHFGDDSVPTKNLSRVDFATQYSHLLSGGKMWGSRLSLGSASDHLFASAGDLTIAATGYYSFPEGPNPEDPFANRWILSIFFSNNNPITNYIPIPGFIYMVRTKTFLGMFGVPLLMAQWNPIDLWFFTASAFGPLISGEIAYGDRMGLQGFTGFSWTQQLFLRDGRPDSKTRLYFVEKRLFAGVRMPFLRAFAAELQSGYTFARSLYEGTGLTNHDQSNQEFDAGWFVAFNFRMLF